MKRLSSRLKIVGFVLILFTLSSCSSNTQSKTLQEENKQLLQLGDSIATEAQYVLLQNVAEAMQQGGSDHAVEFCNANALSITSKIADNFKSSIQRLSDKNRNPNNAISTKQDSLAWQRVKAEKSDFIVQSKNGEKHYYKPISITMPTCLKCHGSKTDIPESTQKIIAQKYPNDKAIDYKTGDLRGMWKIQLADKTN